MTTDWPPLGLTLFPTDAASRGYDMTIYRTWVISYSGGGQPAGRYWPRLVEWKQELTDRLTGSISA